MASDAPLPSPGPSALPAMPRTVYNDLLCNLCWEVLDAPFFITSCNHAFCRHHHLLIGQTSKCPGPGCGSQLVLESDVRMARLRVGADETNALVGLQPDVVRELANNAFEFWNVQECARTDFRAHIWSEAKMAVDEQEQRFARAHELLTQELLAAGQDLLAARQRVQQATERVDELKQELFYTPSARLGSEL